MNYLLHLYLSNDTPELIVGNFMGDFIKGRLDDRYPPAIRQGLVLHRKIDTYAQNHPLFRLSRSRLDDSCGLYRGVHIDLFYDHFLAANWSDWSQVPFENWLARMRQTVEAFDHVLPPRLRELVPIVFSELLPSYQTVEGTAAALDRMARRVRKPDGLRSGGAELIRNYGTLHHDFRSFLPAVHQFVRNNIENNSQDFPL